MRQGLLAPCGAAALIALTACQRGTGADPRPVSPAGVVVVEEPRWRSAATHEDIVRLERVEEAWEEALGRARRSGYSRQVAAEGPLLDPNAALARPSPSPGSYLCRLIRFGSDRARGRAFTAFRPFFCYVGVERDLLSLTKQTGSERPGGYLWEDEDARRMIFLGTMAIGQEEAPRAYGEDSERDLAGVFERVGPFRYRLVIPRLRGGLTLDVFELIPAPVQHRPD